MPQLSPNVTPNPLAARQTEKPVDDICLDHGISPSTLRDRVRRWRWTPRRLPIPAEGPPPDAADRTGVAASSAPCADRALAPSRAAAAPRDGAAGSPAPHAHRRRDAGRSGRDRAAAAGRDRARAARDRGDRREVCGWADAAARDGARRPHAHVAHAHLARAQHVARRTARAPGLSTATTCRKTSTRFDTSLRGRIKGFRRFERAGENAGDARLEA